MTKRYQHGRTIRLVLLLPFFLVANLFSFVAGMIGGRQWRVAISLREHREGETMAEVNVSHRIIE